MKRSPQKLKTQPGQHPAWQCEISGKLRTIPVTSDTELKFLATANAEQQQAFVVVWRSSNIGVLSELVKHWLCSGTMGLEKLASGSRINTQ